MAWSFGSFKFVTKAYSELFNVTRFQKSLTQWSHFRVVACKSRCATRAYSWFTLFSNIHDLSENIELTFKLLADDISLFSVVHNNNTSAELLDRDLQKISEWARKWKMSFNNDVSKQAQLYTLYFQGNKLNHCTQILSLIICQLTRLIPKTFRSIFRHEIKFQTTYQGKNLKSNEGNLYY